MISSVATFCAVSKVGLRLILLSLAFRFLLALLIPLGTDEAYAIAVGRSFSLSFFDHPPVSFWLPALMESIFSSVEPIIIRLPSLVLGTFTLYFLYRIGHLLADEKGALLSVTAFALSPVSLIGGVLMLPDAPLYFGLTGGAFVILKLVRTETANLSLWLLGGGLIAVALASKYQAGLFVISVFIWMLSNQVTRRWLATGRLWLAILIATMGLLPTLIWNLENDWASFKFHTGRAGGGIDLQNFFTMFVAQAIYVFPTLMALSVLSIFAKDNWKITESRLFLLVGLLPVLMFNAIYLGSSGTLPHWTLPGWILLFPLASLILVKQSRKRLSWLLVYPGLLVQITLLVAAAHLKWGVISAFSDDLPKWDDTAPLINHSEARAQFGNDDYLQSLRFVVANNWIDAGHLSVALGPSMPIKILADEKHHFQYMGGESFSGETALLKITTLRKADAEMKRLLSFANEIDPSAVEKDRIILTRGERAYFVVLVVSLKIPTSSVSQ